MSDHEQIRIHLASGEQIDAIVTHDELDELSLESVEDYIEHQLGTPPTPHWTSLGHVRVFTQAVQAVETL